VGWGGYIPRSDITLLDRRIYFVFENPAYLVKGLACRDTGNGDEVYAYFDPMTDIEPVKPAVDVKTKYLYASYRAPDQTGGVLSLNLSGGLRVQNALLTPVGPAELVVHAEAGLVYACAWHVDNPSPSVICLEGGGLALVWDAFDAGLLSSGQEMAPVLGSGLLHFAAQGPGGTFRVSVDPATGGIVSASPCSEDRHCYLAGSSGWLFDRSDLFLTVWDAVAGILLSQIALPGEARADFYVDPRGINLLNDLGQVVHLE
jgi:hypothetical protein